MRGLPHARLLDWFRWPMAVAEGGGSGILLSWRLVLYLLPAAGAHQERALPVLGYSAQQYSSKQVDLVPSAVSWKGGISILGTYCYVRLCAKW